MRHVTGRAVRIAVGTAAAVATLALPLALGILHTTPSDSAPSVRAAQAPPADSDPGDPGDLPLPKPSKPTGPPEDTGSWVWDKFN
ncbi:hypothetical protein ACFYWX_08115 [Streptomyces sp. NPDC002888]|uniref:hypothetical protein n=1 Tax=Streptomyces sp. NPDC002888 TaxID=3364668 RepID=UPI003680BC31